MEEIMAKPRKTADSGKVRLGNAVRPDFKSKPKK
jgi:hypothetical protein